MSYDVDWIPSATNELADLWRTALDRQAVTEASDRVDRLLAADPRNAGVPFKDHRVLLMAPLIVAFRIDEANRRVFVLQVSRAPSGNGRLSSHMN